MRPPCRYLRSHLVVFVRPDRNEGHVVQTVEVLSEVLQRCHEAELALVARRQDNGARSPESEGWRGSNASC